MNTATSNSTAKLSSAANNNTKSLSATGKSTAQAAEARGGGSTGGSTRAGTGTGGTGSAGAGGGRKKKKRSHKKKRVTPETKKTECKPSVTVDDESEMTSDEDVDTSVTAVSHLSCSMIIDFTLHTCTVVNCTYMCSS